MDKQKFEMLRAQVEARRAQRNMMQEQVHRVDNIQAVSNVQQLMQEIQAERSRDEDK